ncbi:hypothetical protein JCM33374_g3034 [Metschnikowia sp. JCM 33374]|nr:hypothetical protein JCM33374_g3034 [Metschnikowia sp. JCM 33374]
MSKTEVAKEIPSADTEPKVQPTKPKIDVKLLDQQLADIDSDELDSDDEDHNGGCSCCPGKVGQIRQD